MRVTIDRRKFLAVSSAAAGTCILNSAFASPALNRFPTVEKIRAGGPEYWKLVDMINAYRRTNDLPAVPLSPRLTAVAYLHARDLSENQPHERYGSMHSWSDDPRWSGGAYRPGDKSTYPIMWDKPKEITGYDGIGFEICVKQARDMNKAFEAWTASSLHRGVILSQGTWADPRWQWRAVGAVFHNGYACGWFGATADQLE